MSIAKRPFIKVPYFLKLAEQNLKYLDILTYIAVKSFDNPDSECFPSYETISERSGLSRDFTIKSIKRLRNANYLQIWRRSGFIAPNKSYPNHYYFKRLGDNDPHFMIDYSVLEPLTATNYEKSILILLFQLRTTQTQIFGDIQSFSDTLGLSKQIIYKNYLSLTKKGFLGKSKLKNVTLLNVNWNINVDKNNDFKLNQLLKVG